MVSLKEYVEEKECNEIFNEGYIMDVIGHLLGFGATAAIYAWVASLIVKGGVKAVNSISKTLTGKEKIRFQEAVKEAKKSPAVKDQIVKQEEKNKKYEDEISDILECIKKRDLETASKLFKDLDPTKQNSTEIKRIIIAECSKEFGYVISGTPTPGTPTFKAIRTVLGLPEAKAAAAAFETGIEKMMGEN